MQKIHVVVVDASKDLYLDLEPTVHSYQVRIHEFGEDVTFVLRSVQTGSDVCEALKNQCEQPVDMVLLAHNTRSFATRDMLLDLKRIDPEVVVIVVAINPRLQEALQLTRAGAFEFLVSPLPPVDIRATLRKAAKQILAHRKAIALEEERRKIRFQFLSVLAHELKAPIAAIEGYLELMQDKSLGDSIEAYQNFITRSLSRLGGMRRLILDLLDLTRLESGQMKLEPEDLLLTDVVQETLEILLPEAERRHITVAVDIAEGARLWADRQHLLMVCNNLLSNAIKYNRDGGQVHFRVIQRDSSVLMECQDTGIGMKKEDVDRLFGEFTRIKTEETRNIPGSGLGLSILRKIVNLYRGTIAVESSPGVGSTFRIVLNQAPSAGKESQ